MTTQPKRGHSWGNNREFRPGSSKKGHHHFKDAEWDGEPLEPEPPRPIPIGLPVTPSPTATPQPPRPIKIKIKLADGKVRALQHMSATTFLGANGMPMSAAQFLETMYGTLPEFFKDEDELRRIWSARDTRRNLLLGLEEKGFGKEPLREMQKIIEAQDSDLFDVLAYVAFAADPETRAHRAGHAKTSVLNQFTDKQQPRPKAAHIALAGSAYIPAMTRPILLAILMFATAPIWAETPQFEQGFTVHMNGSRAKAADQPVFYALRQPVLPNTYEYFYTLDQLAAFFERTPASVRRGGLWVKLRARHTRNAEDEKETEELTRRARSRGWTLYLCEPALSRDPTSKIVAWNCTKANPLADPVAVTCEAEPIKPGDIRPVYKCAE